MQLFENRNYASAGVFVEELARSGLRNVVICPGSRSSPLSVSFWRNKKIKTWMHLDERSASFFALGMAKELNEPVAIVCSSGTASANFMPAVVEAHYSNIPVLVLTADRPADQVDWGALQTIDQTRVYGSHVKWSLDMPPASTEVSYLTYVRSVANRAYFTSAGIPPGPVHINFHLSEPLEPVQLPEGFLVVDDSSELALMGRSAGRPLIQASDAIKTPREEDIADLVNLFNSSDKGLIICGPQTDIRLADAVTKLARKLNYPILCDVLSQVRNGYHDKGLIVDAYDAFLRDGNLARSLTPEIVIRFGSLPVSKPLVQYLEQNRQSYQILIDEFDGWRDPDRVISRVLHVDPVSFCLDVSSRINNPPRLGNWIDAWLNLSEISRRHATKALEGFDGMFEGRIFPELSKLLPEGSIVFAGNGMPVRDMDTFTPLSNNSTKFLSNRGASGIDGVVSSALGVSAVSGKNTLLVIGDISFIHDMNGLLAAKAHSLNCTIIVVNNDGGGIFSFLPQYAYDDIFEPLFGTPHGLTFRAAADLYGLEYMLVNNWEEFGVALEQSLTTEGTTIIEIPGDRDSNVTMHRVVWEKVSSSIQSLPLRLGEAFSIKYQVNDQDDYSNEGEV